MSGRILILYLLAREICATRVMEARGDPEWLKVGASGFWRTIHCIYQLSLNFDAAATWKYSWKETKIYFADVLWISSSAHMIILSFTILCLGLQETELKPFFYLCANFLRQHRDRLDSSDGYEYLEKLEEKGITHAEQCKKEL